MARKKAPVIIGRDPQYTTNFKAGFTPIPTNMPKAGPEPEQIKPQTNNKETTAHEQSTEKDAVTRVKKGKADEALKTKIKKQGQKRNSGSKAKAKRYVYLFATPQKKHLKMLDALEAKGITPKDVSRIAGRRANSTFKPTDKYVAPAEVERLSSQYRYTTTKNVDQAILEKLHKTTDPLRLKSDAAMLQGQFEAIYWEELEKIYQEYR